MSKVAEWSADNLERAAKHLKELDASVNAKAAIELAKREQDVDIAREKSRSKEFEAMRSASVANAERTRWEEQRKTLEAKAMHERATLDYRSKQQMELLQHEDSLARKRDEDNRRRALEDERMKAAIRRQAEEELQAERRRTDEHRAKLERENMRARAVAEAEGRIKEQRENEDVLARQAAQRLAGERETRLEEIRVTLAGLADGFRAFISSPAQLGTTVLAMTALAAGVYGSREGARVVARVVEKRLGAPSLVRETSRSVRHFSLAARAARALGRTPSGGEGHSLADVVLRADVSARVAELAVAVRNTRAHGAPYRHMLFYGPPGTGKTMVAKRLARSSGMDYAIMSGGDVGPLGRDAVTELHKLFDWASTSRRGVLLFIDEADAFLGSRSRGTMSEDQRNALNALLFRTGEASTSFMLVLATNRPGDLDRAIGDRIDEAMVFDLPDVPARRRLVHQYFDKYIVHAGDAAPSAGLLGLVTGGGRAAARIAVDADAADGAYLDGLADRLQGFSGREIAKLFISAQGTVYGRGAAALSRSVLEEVVAWKLAEHDAKAHFGASAYDFVSQAEAHARPPAQALVTARASVPGAGEALAGGTFGTTGGASSPAAHPVNVELR